MILCKEKTAAILLSLFLFCFSNFSQARRTAPLVDMSPVTMKVEKDFNFLIDYKLLQSGVVQYFFETSGKVGDTSELSASLKTIFESIKALDLREVWEQKGDAKYAINVNRIAYIARKPVSFFSKATISSKAYLNVVTKDFIFEDLRDPNFPNDIVVRASTHGAFIPSATFRVAYFKDLESYAPSSQEREAIFVVRRLNPTLGAPNVIVIQEGYDFSKVAGKETSKRAYTIASHYAIDKDTTLTITYNLSFLINLPPVFSQHFLRAGMVDATKYYVEALGRL